MKNESIGYCFFRLDTTITPETLTRILTTMKKYFRKNQLNTVNTMTLVLFIVMFPCAKSGHDNKQEINVKKPIKVYILAGQSNMLEMGNVTGGNSRHTGFYETEKKDSKKGLNISVYRGKFDPDINYDKKETVTSQLVVYDGLAKQPFPKANGPATYVARGFIEVKDTGIYKFSPGYGNSTYNITVVDGKEVYRKEPGKDAVHVTIKLNGGKRYPVKTTFLTENANSLFWVGRTDIPGTLDTLVKQQGRFKYMLDSHGQWVQRNDVLYQDARLHGGWNWDKKDQNKLVLDESRLIKACRPLTVEKGVWVGIPFGIKLGDFHDEQVLIIRTAIGNRALGWDFRPPSSGKLPNIKDDLKKWESAEYRMMVDGVRATLKNIAKIVPNYKGQGYEIAGFVWFQGHRDTGSKDTAEEYEQNLCNLIKDIRKEFQAPKLPVMVATIGFDGFEMIGNTKTVWAAQMAVGDAKKHPEFADTVKTVDTRGFWRPKEVSPSGQGYHYNRNSETYMLVGEALATGMMELQKKSAQESKGDKQ